MPSIKGLRAANETAALIAKWAQLFYAARATRTLRSCVLSTRIGRPLATLWSSLPVRMLALSSTLSH